ncbi:hypothetical protein PIB30_056101 [Stylosanthes scabra]|uniref:DUF4283 domain-containing protein n=1 Tax=Stylosanthes scabra TaxID=79078 RepID=A0ABU6XH60_9FABA|nr:hypothetical protein [Stylosanthes scabra]
MDIVPIETGADSTTKGSYKDSLLALSGPSLEGKPLHEEIVNEDDPNPEDRWYKDDSDKANEETLFNPCTTIPVSKEEFEEWCKPWRHDLMVKVLGKRVTLGFMEQCLQRDWQKRTGPWMVAGHYLIVQRWRPFFLSGGANEQEATDIGDQPPARTNSDETCANNGKSINSGIKSDTSKNNSNGNDYTDFGPWMMVKRFNRKKKFPPNQGAVNAHHGSNYKINSGEDSNPNDKDLSQGSHFNMLQEDNPEEVQPRVVTTPNPKGTNPTNGPSSSQAHNATVTKKQSIQKKVLEPGAGKNPQSQKKQAPPIKLGSDTSSKGGKSRANGADSSVSISKGREEPKVVSKERDKKSDTDDMELVVMENMKQLRRDQWEAYLVAKGSQPSFDSHLVRDNHLFTSSNHPPNAGPMDLDREEGLALTRPPDTHMSDSNLAQIKEAFTSSDTNGQIQRISVRK